jgi:hypothetical protein
MGETDIRSGKVGLVLQRPKAGHSLCGPCVETREERSCG